LKSFGCNFKTIKHFSFASCLNYDFPYAKAPTTQHCAVYNVAQQINHHSKLFLFHTRKFDSICFDPVQVC